jgi:hypothetical protein
VSTELAHQQATLLQALRSAGGQPAGAYWPRGLAAYRSNAFELARRALGGAYPVVEQLLGEDNFRALSHSLWLAHPPRRGDLAHWGGELATHIGSLPDLREQEPFLADVAGVEWLLHVAASARDAALDGASLRLLEQADPSDFTLILCPGAACFASRFPVVSIVNAHLAGQPSLQEAGLRLDAGLRETALVWRQGLVPRLREALRGEAAFVAALQESRSLADSLEAAPELEFDQWLTPAVQTGLMVGAASNAT